MGLENKVKQHINTAKEKAGEYNEQARGYLESIPPVVAETLIADNALDRPPLKVMRLLLRSMLAFVVIAVLWATFSKVDVVVTAIGKVVPSGKVKVVQAAEAGVVREIHVRDGQAVTQGQVLIELDTTATQADKNQVATEMMIAQLDVARLQAVLEGNIEAFNPPEDVPAKLLNTQQSLLKSTLEERQQKLALLKNEIANRQAEQTAAKVMLDNLKKSVPLLKDKLMRHQALFDDGYLSQEKLEEVKMTSQQAGSDLKVQKHKLEQAESALSSAEREYEWAVADYRKTTLDALAEATKRRDNASQDVVKAKQRQGMQSIRAPLDGVVQQLEVNTIGGVVTQAQPLLVIVPNDSALEVNANILNQDIGSVTEAKKVAVKIDTFDFTRFGSLDGKIDWIATNAVNDEQLGAVFPVRITIDQSTTPNAVNGRVGKVLPGMSVTADIVIGKRRMIEYFLGPILRYKDESLRER